LGRPDEPAGRAVVARAVRRARRPDLALRDASGGPRRSARLRHRGRPRRAGRSPAGPLRGAGDQHGQQPLILETAMYIDRHRVAELIALSAAAARSAAERDLYRDHLEVLLVNLYNGATPAAREAFLKQMNAVPADQKPWTAVMRP